MKEGHFARSCRVADKTELLDDPRYVDAEHRKQNARELRAIFVDLMRAYTTDEWVERLHTNEVLSNPINTVSDWLSDAHVRATECSKYRSFRIPCLTRNCKRRRLAGMAAKHLQVSVRQMPNSASLRIAAPFICQNHKEKIL